MRRIHLALAIAGAIGLAALALADRSYIMPTTAQGAGAVVQVRIDPCPGQVSGGPDAGSICAPADYQVVAQVQAKADGGATDDFRCVFHVPLSNASVTNLVTTALNACLAAYR